jgi:polysaccharide biosynthesis transport protein
LAEAERASLHLDKLTIDYHVLRRNADHARDTFSQILSRLNETNITSQLETTNIRPVHQASVPGAPVEPNLKRVALLVMFLGGFVFVGVPLGIEFLDNKAKTAWDIEHFLGQKLVAEVPSLAKVAEADRAHVVEKDLEDNATEAFRGLFSQLQLSSAREFPKGMLITSTIPGEGKSFIVSNLAFSFAAHGKRVLMIDCDFRRPVMHRLYEKKNEAGVLRWMEEGADVEKDLLQSEGLGILEIAPNLFLLRSGGNTKKATEVITNPKFQALVDGLKRKFDLVIVDTPPVGIFPDALSLAHLVDEVLYVCRYAKANRQHARSSVERLTETDAELLGVVLNDIPAKAHSAYSYSGRYGYGATGYKYAKYYAEKS